MTHLDLTPPKSNAAKIAKELVFMDIVAVDIREDTGCSHELSQQAAQLLFALHTLTSNGTDPWLDRGQDVIPASIHAVIDSNSPALMWAVTPLTNLSKARHEELLECLLSAGRIKRQASKYGGKSLVTVGPLVRDD